MRIIMISSVYLLLYNPSSLVPPPLHVHSTNYVINYRFLPLSCIKNVLIAILPSLPLCVDLSIRGSTAAH